MTASVFGPGVDRHSSSRDRIAYRAPGVKGDSRLAHIPAMSVACNKFPLGKWLVVSWGGKSLVVFNGDFCGTPSRIDFLIGVWRYFKGDERPGLIRGVSVRLATKEETPRG